MGYNFGHESNQLKSFGVTIDGTKLTNAQIQDFKIVWDIETFKIQGYLTFRDETDLVEEIPIRGDNTLVATMTDYDDVPSTESFKVVKVEYTKSKSGAYLTKVSFIDPISLTALKMYKEMSWASADMIEIIDHPETLKPSLSGKTKDFGPPPPKHTNIVFPMNRSFYWLTEYLKSKNNYYFFQNRKDYVIQPLNKLYVRGKKGDKFRYKTNNESYRRNIYELTQTHGDLLSASMVQPTGKFASFDYNNKHRKYTEKSYEAAASDLSSPGASTHGFSTDGPRHFYLTDPHVKLGVDYMYSNNAYNDLKLEILVPGQFATNIGDIVELDVLNHFTESAPEKNINGKWLITRIIDIIRYPEFLQTLTLSRAKFFT